MGRSTTPRERAGHASHRRGRITVLGALALLTAGCTAADEPLPAEDAVAHDDAAADDLTARLSTQEWTLNSAQRTVREEDGRCRYLHGERTGSLSRPAVVDRALR